MPAVACPRCGAKLNVPEAALGKSGRCPKCQEKFLVQLPAPVDEYDLAPVASPQTASALAPTISRPAETLARPGFQAKSQPDHPPAASTPVWLISAAIGGALLAVSMMALVVWIGFRFMGGGGGGADAAPNGDSAQAAVSDDTPLIAPARAAAAGGNSTVSSVAVASAEPATWKVTVDGVPAPENLKSLIPLDGVVFADLAFPRPDVGEAAVVAVTRRPSDTASVFDWIRCDLRQDRPVERIHLWKEDTPRDDLLSSNRSGVIPMPWSLSPSGERLATARGGTLWVWAKDGTQLLQVKVKGADNQIPWVGFGGEETVWVRWKEELRQYAVADGEVIRKHDATVYSPPSFTPGGKYLLVVSNVGLEILVAADGSRAGLLSFPAGFGTILPPAVNPAGTKVAVAMANNRADTLFVVWDLATGKFDKAIEQTYARVQRRLVEYRLVWLGDELLYVNHVYFHLGLGEIIADEFRDDGNFSGPSPDGRLWQLRSFWDAQQAAQVGEQPRSDLTPPRMYLSAASMPPPAMESIIKQTGGFAWHPGIAVNGVLTGVPAKHRDAVAAGFSNWLSREGFTVDPQAKVKIELKVTREGDSETTGNKIPQDQLTPAMKEYLRTHQHEEWVELLTVKNLVVSGKVYDESGKPAFLVPMRLVSRPVDKGGNDDPVWEALASWKEAPPLPKTFFRDSEGKRVYIPAKYLLPGVDGVAEAIITPPDLPPFVKDEFELPKE